MDPFTHRQGFGSHKVYMWRPFTSNIHFIGTGWPDSLLLVYYTLCTISLLRIQEYINTDSIQEIWCHYFHDKYEWNDSIWIWTHSMNLSMITGITVWYIHRQYTHAPTYPITLNNILGPVVQTAQSQHLPGRYSDKQRRQMPQNMVCDQCLGCLHLWTTNDCQTSEMDLVRKK